MKKIVQLTFMGAVFFLSISNVSAQVKFEGLDSSILLKKKFAAEKIHDSITANNPLYFLDGILISPSDMLNNINTSTINSLDVKKGWPAYFAYGGIGDNGVIEIYTKKPSNIPYKTIAEILKGYEKMQISLVALNGIYVNNHNLKIADSAIKKIELIPIVNDTESESPKYILNIWVDPNFGKSPNRMSGCFYGRRNVLADTNKKSIVIFDGK